MTKSQNTAQIKSATRRHTSPYVVTRRHTSPYVATCRHTSLHVAAHVLRHSKHDWTLDFPWLPPLRPFRAQCASLGLMNFFLEKRPDAIKRHVHQPRFLAIVRQRASHATRRTVFFIKNPQAFGLEILRRLHLHRHHRALCGNDNQRTIFAPFSVNATQKWNDFCAKNTFFGTTFTISGQNSRIFNREWTRMNANQTIPSEKFASIRVHSRLKKTKRTEKK